MNLEPVLLSPEYTCIGAEGVLNEGVVEFESAEGVRVNGHPSVSEGSSESAV